MLNKLSLNTIGLNRIGLNRIGKPSRGSSDRPYIDPEVLASLKAVCICYGKSNDDPDRAIVKNLVDPDNPFIISNAAYKLNSGYGKYEEDFTTWVGAAISINNGAGFKIERNNTGWWEFYTYGVKATNEFKIKVTNCRDAFSWRYKDAEGIWQTMNITKDGIYTLPASQERDEHDAPRFFSGNPNATYNGLTVEQIPSYQGAFVTDGVDDLITSTKTIGQMVGENGDYTIISMIHQISYTHETEGDYDFALTNYIRSGDGYTRSRVTNIGKTAIYGYYANPKNSDAHTYNNILGDKADLFSETNAMPTIYNDKISIQGYVRYDGLMGEFSELAWYWNIFAKGQLTTDQINQVIAYFNLDRCVEPTVLYNVKRQGLSNDTPDSDWYLKDYSGNGYDMTLYNYAKTPESGINEGGGLQSDGVEDYGKVTGLPIYKDYTVVADYERIDIGNIEGIGTPPVLSKSYTVGQGSFIMNFIASTGNSVHTYSFGTENISNFGDLARQIYYQSKYKSQGFDITAGTGIDGDSLWLGTTRDNDRRFFNGAIYSLMSFPYSMSEFLIERQLKKHKLGTLYPDMVEFRPVIKSNVELATKLTFVIRGTSTLLNAGDYIPKDSELWVIVTMNNLVDELTKFSINGKEITIPSSAYNPSTGKYGFPFVIDDKSPQKIDITIDQPPQYLTMLSNSTLISNETLIKNE